LEIPSRVTLFGITYKVSVISADEWEETPDAVGYVLPHRALICIKKGEPQIMLQTYYHEVAHIMMHLMGREKLDKDESFIDLLGSLIHQATITAR
jgi:hypothetical protein